MAIGFVDMLPSIFVDPDEDPNLVISPVIEAWTSIDRFRVAYEIARFTDIVSIQKTDYIDLILANLGNPFNFELTVAEKRNLARALIPIYRLKGTREGLKQSILFFTGQRIEIVDSVSADNWVLGDDELGVGTIAGADFGSMDLFTFVIVLTDYPLTFIPTASLTPPAPSTLLTNIDAIVEFMKPAWTRQYYLEYVLPAVASFEDPSWL